MIFACEGPDGSGKTTLIKEIRSTVKSHNVHFLASSSQPHSTEQIQDELDWLYKLPSSITLICDRWRLISEPIYGRILRDRDLSEDVWERSPGVRPLVVFIYCRPPIETIIKNLQHNAQLSGVGEHISEIVATYDRVMARTRPIEVYDYTTMDNTKFIDSIFNKWAKLT